MRTIKSLVEIANRYSAEDAKDIGDALGVDWDDIDLGQFAIGMNVETEHDDVTHGDPLLTGKIALAHLREVPDYYDKLLRYVEN